VNCLRAECVESSGDRIPGHEVRMFGNERSEPLEVNALSNQLVHCIFKARRVNFRRLHLVEFPYPYSHYDDITAKLASLHQTSYVHGDVRNTNIMVKENGSQGFKVVDFDWLGKVGTTLAFGAMIHFSFSSSRRRSTPHTTLELNLFHLRLGLFESALKRHGQRGCNQPPTPAPMREPNPDTLIPQYPNRLTLLLPPLPLQ